MDFIDDLKKNVADITKKVCQKSNDVIEMQKLRMKKGSLESDLRDTFVKMGEIGYSKYLAGDETLCDEIIALCEQVKANKEAIDEVKEQMNKLKGTKECPNCHAVLDKEDAFCAKCGTEVPVVEVCDCEDCDDCDETCEDAKACDCGCDCTDTDGNTECCDCGGADEEEKKACGCESQEE